MDPRKDHAGTPVQPSLADLMARHLGRQSAAQAAGFAPPDSTDEVVPFEAVPVRPVDAQVAWDEAVSVLRHYRPAIAGRTWAAPPDWASLVAGNEPLVALAFATGNFPQLVRDWHPLLQATDLTTLHCPAERPLPASSLRAWADGIASRPSWPDILLAVGTLRLARHYDRAAEIMDSQEAHVPSPWRDAWANERAALAWHRGQADEAAALWRAQANSVPVLFNRGMVALFLGRPAEARAALGKAVAQLPESDAWHHLGRLYLTLAETREG
jgi:hypothetical protein